MNTLISEYRSAAAVRPKSSCGDRGFCPHEVPRPVESLLKALPDECVDAVITDPMYGTARSCRYDWGLDPVRGYPEKHWTVSVPQGNDPVAQGTRRTRRRDCF